MRNTRVVGGAHWRKSSYSNGQGGDCVEVGGNVPDLVPVRDSKDLSRGVLGIAPDSWASLTNTLKTR